MKPGSPVFAELARRYRSRRAGRTGQGQRSVMVDLEDVLRAAGCAEGEARELAEQQLRAAARAGVLELIPHHPRDPENLASLRLRPELESRFFDYLGERNPTEERAALANQFAAAARAVVPDKWSVGWQRFLERRQDAARSGGAIAPFDRTDSAANLELLALLPRLLSWEGESLRRFASCVLCGDSKRLEQLELKLNPLLLEITDGQVRGFEDFGILPNPRSVLLHGPLRLKLDGEWLDLGRLRGACRVSIVDIARAEEITTTAQRCLTVENEASFHELAKLQSGVLLIQTSYPGSGTLRLLQRLPAGLEYHHFGDSDAAGFEILRVLREQSGRDFQALHMVPGRVPAEQESLGRPTLPHWPFYPWVG